MSTMTTQQISSDEDRYRKSEAEAMEKWRGMAPETLLDRQRDPISIPSWLNAPDWAEWIYYCRQRGWVFLSEKPHVYDDGVVSVHVKQMACAKDIPGVLFYYNKKKYMGQETPRWVCDRREALASLEPAPDTASDTRKDTNAKQYAASGRGPGSGN